MFYAALIIIILIVNSHHHIEVGRIVQVAFLPRFKYNGASVYISQRASGNSMIHWIALHQNAPFQIKSYTLDIAKNF